MKRTAQVLYGAAVVGLKEFVDNDCKEPFQLILETPYTDPQIGVPKDRAYMVTYGHTPNYEQVVFDQLKKYHIVEDSCRVEDYSFLLSEFKKERDIRSAISQDYSHNVSCIQIADYVAGSLFQLYEHEEPQYYDKIKDIIIHKTERG